MTKRKPPKNVQETQLNRLMKTLRNKKASLSELCLHTGTTTKETRELLRILEERNVDVVRGRRGRSGTETYHINVLPDLGNVYHISDAERKTDSLVFGASSDWHLASKFHLPRTWEDAMKRLVDAGVTHVYVAGDILDGTKIYKGHLENIVSPSLEDQTDLVAEAVSKFPELEFLAIAGNHDYSYTQQVGAKPLAIIEAKTDNFKNLGDLRADVIFKGIRIRLLHGAGGRAYALSYPSQSYLRDYFRGLERSQLKDIPHLMIVGHYHTVYQSKDHGIIVLQCGSFQDGENEYCIRRGLTGPHGLFKVDLTVTKGEIEQWKTEYIQPDVVKEERGKQHAKNTKRYKR